MYIYIYNMYINIYICMAIFLYMYIYWTLSNANVKTTGRSSITEPYINDGTNSNNVKFDYNLIYLKKNMALQFLLQYNIKSTTH